MKPAALALVALLSSCSFITISGPPERHFEMKRFECNETKIPAIIDLAGAGFFAWATSEASRNARVSGNTGLVVLDAGAAVLFIVSAVHGFRATTRCTEARDLALQKETLE